MKKALLLHLLILCSIYAQDRHEFSLQAGGGLSTLNYKANKGEQSFGFDKQFGFGYAFFVAQRFGFGTGLEFAFYSADYELNSLEMLSITAHDKDEDTDFTFSSELNNYKEEQSVAMLQIPVLLQFQTNGRHRFYTMAGIKFAIPISSTSNGKGDVVNSGKYEEEKRTYGEGWEFRGFGKFPGRKVEIKESFKSSILTSMEMGMKWRFDDGLSLYTGFYFDYGLNNILKKRDLKDLPQLIEYNENDPPNFAMNGALNSQWMDKSTSQEIVSKIKPLAIGFKLKLAFGLGVDDFVEKDEREEDRIALAAAEEARLLEEKDREKQKAKDAAAESARFVAAETARLAAAAEKEQAERNDAAAKNAAAEVARLATETARLAAEKIQLEQEIARLAASPPPQQQQVPPATVGPEIPPGSGEYIVQVAVVLYESRADSMVASLKQNGFNAYYKKVNNPGKLTGVYYRVRVGYFSRPAEAEAFAKTRLQSYSDWWIDRAANDTK